MGVLKKWSQRFVNKNVNLDEVCIAILAVVDKAGLKIKEHKIEQMMIKGKFESFWDFSPGKINIRGNARDFSVFLEWETKESINYYHYPLSSSNHGFIYMSKKMFGNSGKAWKNLTKIIPLIIEELHKGITNWFSNDYYLSEFLRYAFTKLKDSSP